LPTLRVAAAIVALALAAGPGHAAAEPPAREGPSETWFVRGGKELSLSLGYGLGVRTGSAAARSRSRELGDVSLVEVIPRFGIGVSDPLGGEAWYRGNLEALVEGALAFNTHPRFGYALGGGSTLRYNFLSWDRFVPFLDANLGVVYLDFDLEGQSDGFNFNVGFGAGFHQFVSKSTALTPAVRYQHFSNAGLNEPNRGINDVLFLLGISCFWQ
jgi:lipid A 3-O-deacylase